MFVVPCICTQCVFHGNKSNFNAGICNNDNIEDKSRIVTNFSTKGVSIRLCYIYDQFIYHIQFSHPRSFICLFHLFIIYLFLFAKFVFALNIFICFTLLTYICLYILYLFLLHNLFSIYFNLSYLL